MESMQVGTEEFCIEGVDGRLFVRSKKGTRETDCIIYADEKRVVIVNHKRISLMPKVRRRIEELVAVH